MKVIKRIAVAVFILLIAFFLIRAIGREIYKQAPDGGINESMYIDINGTKQWINIYGASCIIKSVKGVDQRKYLK